MLPQFRSPQQRHDAIPGGRDQKEIRLLRGQVLVCGTVPAGQLVYPPETVDSLSPALPDSPPPLLPSALLPPWTACSDFHAQYYVDTFCKFILFYIWKIVCCPSWNVEGSGWEQIQRVLGAGLWRRKEGVDRARTWRCARQTKPLPGVVGSLGGTGALSVVGAGENWWPLSHRGVSVWSNMST